jgi:hypothetical protein
MPEVFPSGKCFLMSKVVSLRTKDAAQDENVAGISHLNKNWIGGGVVITKWRDHEERIHEQNIRITTARTYCLLQSGQVFIAQGSLKVCYPLSFTDPTNVSLSSSSLTYTSFNRSDTGLNHHPEY